jgi:hypothetical protein
MASDSDLKRQGKQTHDLHHCDDPGCLTGVLIGICRRCKQLAAVGTECVGETKDAKEPFK